MKLLLDTHAAIWTLAAPSLLSEEARTAIANPRNRATVSLATAWELCIKSAIGKLEGDAWETLLASPASFSEQLDAAGLELLPIEPAHVFETRRLPRLHRDPFDRLLIAQAIVEDLVLVSRDAMFERYDVRLLRA